MLSVKQAAEVLGVSRQRVYQYIKNGNLKAEEIGGYVLIKKDEVEKFQPKSNGRPKKNGEEND